MKFNVLRDLTNKVFTSTVARVVVPNDADDIIEAKLENDFGAVKVEAGGLFEGFINKDSITGLYSADLVSAGTVGVDSIAFKYALSPNEIAISSTTQIAFKSDAKLESPIKFDASNDIAALKVSELKCELFEKAIQKRIQDAVTAWKAETTTFESTVPADTFVVSLQ